ncbi:MAG: dTMP kinase [Candidatus Omnitrophica bacterium]|nr:dTMP kinase [Candidatus Omnitrophota bacterium]
MKKKKGYFITLEGIEGCGKSTQICHVARYFKRHKKPYIIVREPGGTKIGEKIREILLDKKNNAMAHSAEVLLYCAARAQIVHEVIAPALKKGITVICDRFYDSTIAYQGYGLGMDLRRVQDLCAFAADGLVPDITLLLDLPVKTGLTRAGRTDRIEGRSLRYHEKVRKGFLALARAHKRRFFVINATQKITAVKERIESILDDAFGS